MTKENKYLKFLIIALAAAIIVPQIALAAWWNPFSWSWGRMNSIFHFQQTAQKQEQQNKPQIIGGDKDSHGCLGSAGYTWCEVKQKCLRSWEEKCEKVMDQTAGWKTYTNTEYGFEFRYPSDYIIKNTSSGFRKNSLTTIFIIKNITDYESYPVVTFEIVKDENSSLLDEIANTPILDPKVNIKSGGRIINGSNWYTFEVTFPDIGRESSFYINKAGKAYILRCETCQKSDILAEIMPTFKFTK